MNNMWSHLPNAKYIDMIFADFKANPKKWDNARSFASPAWDAAWSDACSVASSSSWEVIRGAVWSVTWKALGPGTWDMVAPRGAVLALVAFDDCAYLLDEKPEHVQLLSLLGDNPAAALMYPACMALRSN